MNEADPLIANCTGEDKHNKCYSARGTKIETLKMYDSPWES
jgi:hypothetical protein